MKTLPVDSCGSEPLEPDTTLGYGGQASDLIYKGRAIGQAIIASGRNVVLKGRWQAWPVVLVVVAGLVMCVSVYTV